MRALVVYESMFGNTEQVAGEIAAGLGESLKVSLRDVAENPAVQWSDFDVLVVGGPTHAFSTSTPRSRADAWRRGGRMGVLKTGLREWLDQLPEPPAPKLTAAFDTRATVMRVLPGSAARAAARVLRGFGCSSLSSPTSFYVKGDRGQLARGELERARAWGRSIATAAGEAQPGDGGGAERHAGQEAGS
jgi:hypothetical protein